MIKIKIFWDDLVTVTYHLKELQFNTLVLNTRVEKKKILKF